MTETTNSDQYEAWNGESGSRWVANADRRDQVLAPIADLMLDRAHIAVGENILDVGCGCGTTSIAAGWVTGPTGTVIGVDLSAPMLDVARQRLAASEAANVDFVHADAQTVQLGTRFEIAISRFGTMFYADPVAAFTNIATHLRPAGRLCIATWQPLDANPWLVVPGAALLQYGTLPDGAGANGPGMFAQSDHAAIITTLQSAGFINIACEPCTVPLTFGETVNDAVDYLASSGPGREVLDTVPIDLRDSALAAVRDVLARHAANGAVTLDAGIWITTAERPGRPSG